MRKTNTNLGLSALALGAFTLTACSFSESSKSISASIESSSDSASSVSSGSSPKDGIGKEKLPYRDDVANLTYSIAGSSISAADFPNALARTASQFKISNWSQEKATYYGIAKGLKRAGIARENVARTPFLAKVLSANANALKYIQEGYKY